MLTYNPRIVHIFRRSEFEHLIFVNVIVEFSGSQAEAGGDFSPIQCLPAAVDHALFDQRDDGIVEHFGMNTEIAFVTQVIENSLWDSPNTYLDR